MDVMDVSKANQWVLLQEKNVEAYRYPLGTQSCTSAFPSSLNYR